MNEIDYEKFSGVKKALAMYNGLERGSYKGDTAAHSILIDIKRAVICGGLTEKQMEVVWLYFLRCMPQEQIARKLSISRQSVNERLNGAIRKIQKTLLSGELYS
ncbi:MAG: sigma-70 family RNA polymerase sigma factor [Tissierellia bacterium]|nr:sigma-70 family RNA polymerase sigma factor [Tissierellia bacterium]